MGRRLRALVCAGLLPATGCSYMFVYAPPPEAARSGGPERIECTTRSRAPAVDTVLGIALSGLALPLLAAQSNCDTADGFCLDWSGVFHSAGAVLLGSGALELASGVYGRSAIRSCRRAVGLDPCPSTDPATCERLGFPLARDGSPQPRAR